MHLPKLVFFGLALIGAVLLGWALPDSTWSGTNLGAEADPVAVAAPAPRPVARVSVRVVPADGSPNNAPVGVTENPTDTEPAGDTMDRGAHGEAAPAPIDVRRDAPQNLTNPGTPTLEVPTLTSGNSQPPTTVPAQSVPAHTAVDDPVYPVSAVRLPEDFASWPRRVTVDAP